MTKKEILKEIESQQTVLGKLRGFLNELMSEDPTSDLLTRSALTELDTAVDYMQVNLSALTDRIRMS